jgi:hypothetical protein
MQVLRIEREIEHVAIVREMDQLRIEATALSRDLELLDRKGRLATLLPIYSLRNLDLANEQLTAATNRIVSVVSHELFPFAYLRYPETMQGLVSTQQLLGFDWNSGQLGDAATASTLASRVKIATDEIKNRFDDVVLHSTDPGEGEAQEAYAVVRFPNPYNPPPEPSAVIGKAADVVRSARVWDAIRQPFLGGPTVPVKFEITLDDLYRAGSSNGSLPCQLTSPSIKNMALFVVTSNSNASEPAVGGTYTGQAIRAATSVENSLSFPTATGIEQFQIANEDFLSSSNKVYYGPQESWKPKFDALTPADFSTGARGLPPNMTFTVAATPEFTRMFDWWWGTPHSTRELMVVMRVEGRWRSTGVQGVPSCNGL